MYKLVYLARRNPEVSREDWPRIWRSHAIFASQFPVLESGIAYMRYCNRLEVPGLRGISEAHDGVAIAAGDRLDGLNGAGFSEADRARIDEDELRVFDMLTPNFTFYCTEAVLRDGAPGEAALFRFLARKPDATRDDFDLRFGVAHADLVGNTVARLNSVTRCVHNRPVHEPLPLFPFDGVVETWFASSEDAVAAISDGSLKAVDDDLADFCDPARGIAVLTTVCHRWPKDWHPA